MDPQQPKKIIIIEDEKFIADLYSRQLTNAGFSVQTAYDGLNGLKLLETQTFDLLLLDIMLPGINGLELLKQWKAKNQSSVMPILLLTNLGQDAVIKEGFDLGASGYLIKASYTPAQVVQEVKNALEGKQAGSPNPNPPSGGTTPPSSETPPSTGTPPPTGNPPGTPPQTPPTTT